MMMPSMEEQNRQREEEERRRREEEKALEMAMMRQRAIQAQQAQPSSGGVNPQMAAQMAQSFGGGGGATGSGAGSGAASGTTAGGAGSGAASGGAAGGGSAGGSALASAAPWAALAAAIIYNEDRQNSAGNRDDNRTSRGVDMLSGAVLEQDLDRYGDKVGGPLGKAMKIGGKLGNPEGLLKVTKKSLKPWEWF